MFEEFLTVLSYSRRTQFVLVLGVVFFAGFMLGGAYMVSNLELKSVSGSLADVIRDRLLHRYDKAAWFCLISSLFAAVGYYRKDRKRWFGS